MIPKGQVAAEIERRLKEAFNPEKLVVENQSEQHRGHSGYRDGETHFHVAITAQAFKGLTRVQQQRLVMAQLRDMMPKPVHALALSVNG